MDDSLIDGSNNSVSDGRLDLVEFFGGLRAYGIFIGRPSLTLRLFGSNLNDKLETRKYTYEVTSQLSKSLRKRVSAQDLVSEVGKFYSSNIFYITGGEPLMQQEELIKLLTLLQERYNNKYIIELETNTKIRPLPELDKFINHYTLNVRLPNSMPFGNNRDAFDNRVNIENAKWFLEKPSTTIVVTLTKAQEINQVLELQNKLEVQGHRIHVVPYCTDILSLRSNGPSIYDVCVANGFVFNPPLNNILFPNKPNK